MIYCYTCGKRSDRHITRSCVGVGIVPGPRSTVDLRLVVTLTPGAKAPNFEVLGPFAGLQIGPVCAYL